MRLKRHNVEMVTNDKILIERLKSDGYEVLEEVAEEEVAEEEAADECEVKEVAEEKKRGRSKKNDK